MSDEEDEEDAALNASTASTYSHVSINEANTTLRPFLSNTIPMVSPRDKRRQRESEVSHSGQSMFTFHSQSTHADNILYHTLFSEICKISDCRTRSFYF